jgi:general stress protein YciG
MVAGTRKKKEDTVARDPRGFAGMSRDKQREIASKGGKAAHAKGTAHEWSREEAREAGRKGALAARRKKSPALRVVARKTENQPASAISPSPVGPSNRNAGTHSR